MESLGRYTSQSPLVKKQQQLVRVTEEEKGEVSAFVGGTGPPTLGALSSVNSAFSPRAHTTTIQPPLHPNPLPIIPSTTTTAQFGINFTKMRISKGSQGPASYFQYTNSKPNSASASHSINITQLGGGAIIPNTPSFSPNDSQPIGLSPFAVKPRYSFENALGLTRTKRQNGNYIYIYI